MRLLILALASTLSTQAPALRIVVLEGEDAVNIVQQKTAVRPLVEVRDRNNVPVAGATVTFTIGGGQPAAFAGGVQTLTVTTNAAGQAAASGFNVLGPGAVQMQVQAAYQGQIATAAISQTNFATAAAASQASAAGGGGGMSGTTIGIVGAAVAGGAVAATQVGGEDKSSPQTAGPQTFTGPFSAQYVFTTTTSSPNVTVTCSRSITVSATMTITLRDGASGSLQTTGTRLETSVSGGPTCIPNSPATQPYNISGEVTGGPSNLTFSFQSSFTSTEPATVTSTTTINFKGGLSNGTITGTLAHIEGARGTNLVNGISSNIVSNGQFETTVTLR